MTQIMSRQLILDIDLSGAQIQVDRIEVVEALGRPFVITLDIFSSHAELDLMPHLGKSAAVNALEDDDITRYFHGIITEGEYLSEQSSGYHYRLVLRPWTHLLSYNRNFAIFQQMATIDIVREVLSTFGFADVDYSKVSQGRTREYCVQYGESDFAFLSRLLEEDGFYYYFDHQASGHSLVLCDSASAHVANTAGDLTYNPDAAGVANAGSSMRSFLPSSHYLSRWNERVVSGSEAKVTLRDFDFTKPQQPLEQISTENQVHALDQLEIYDWPGRYTAPADGAATSKIMLEARRANRQTYSGESQNIALAVGTKIALSQHPNSRFNRSYLITRAHHILSSENYRSGGGSGMQLVHFEAIHDDVSWRSPQITPRPVVRGPETAIVTGPSGEEIHTDEYGRVKVRFHWDRSETSGENTTCWIRVSQTGGLGNIILPRVGHEVLVDFLDGDPDRPLVVGRVFNADNMPIYPLPANKTKALWRTKRYGETGDYGNAKALDTGAPGANELRFEDNGGEEEVFLHAERDLKVRVRNLETHNVGLDQSVDIGGSRGVKIQESDQNDVGKSIKVTAGTTIDIEAETSITFKVGQTTIVMDQTSITMKTTQLKVEAQATVDMKSPMTTVKGDGMLTLKGGITMIN